MNAELYTALLAFLVAVVGMLMLFVDRSNKRTMDVARAVIGAAETFAKMTPGTADDEQVARLKELVLGAEPPAPPADPGAEG